MDNFQKRFDAQMLENCWSKFSSLIYNEIKNLKQKESKISIEIKKISNLKKNIEISKNDIEFMLEHKKTFTDIDESLEQIFSALIKFKEMNALSNGVVPQLIKKIFNSQKIINSINKLKELEEEKIKISERINSLEKLRDGTNFTDELIIELANYFGLDKTTSRQLRVYALRKSSKKKVDTTHITKQHKRTSETVTKPKIAIEEKEVKVEQQTESIYHEYQNPFETTQEKNETDYIFDTKVKIEKKEKNHILSQYRKLVSDFEKANNKFSYLISKYKEILKEVEISKIENYDKECKLIEKTYPNIEEYELKNKYRIKKLIVLYHQLIEQRDSILKLIKIEYSKIKEEDIEILSVYIENFEKIGELLKEIDKTISIETINIDKLDETNENKQEEVKLEETASIKIESSKTNEIEVLNSVKFQSKRYDKLKENFKELINKYFNIQNNLKTQEKQYYESYATLSEKEFKEIHTTHHKKSNFDEAYSILLSIKLFEVKDVIEEIIQKISTEKIKEEDAKYLEELINEFQSLGDKLKKVDAKIMSKSALKNETNKPSNVFFLMNHEGENILNGSSKKSMQTCAKIAENSEVENIIKKNPFVIKSPEIGRNILVQRINDIAISYVVVKTNEGDTGNGILLIGAAPVSGNGYGKIQNITQKTVSQHQEEIKEQIRLIESKNPEYYAIQVKLRKEIKEKTRSSGGKKE